MIKAIFPIIGILSIILLPASAEDITTLKGKVYEDVKVQRVEPDGITIKYASGIGKIYFSELPQDVRNKYGYDPEKHKQYYDAQQRQAARVKLIRSMEGTAVDVYVKLSQVLDSGSLAYITAYRSTVTNTVTDTHSGTSTSYDPLSGAQQEMPSGSQGSVVRAEVKTYIDRVEQGEPIFILGLHSGYVDGDTWAGKLYPIGTYNYTTVQGAPKKIEQYTISRDVAVQYYEQ